MHFRNHRSASRKKISAKAASSSFYAEVGVIIVDQGYTFEGTCEKVFGRQTRLF